MIVYVRDYYTEPIINVQTYNNILFSFSSLSSHVWSEPAFGIFSRPIPAYKMRRNNIFFFLRKWHKDFGLMRAYTEV